MEDIKKLAFMAVFIEATTTYIKNVCIDYHLTISMCITFLLGIVIAMVYDLDLPKQIGITTKVKFIGNIITGVIISRGSNYIYDFIGKFTQ